MTTEETMSTPVVKPVNEDAPLDAATFDLAKWVEGVQPVRRATTIYGRGDLAADLDLIKEKMTDARASADTAMLDELHTQAALIVEELQASAVDIVVEGWSNDRLRAFHEAAKENGLTKEEAIAEQVAAQIVSPEGFTGDFYTRLLEVVPQQANKIFGIVMQANNAPVDVSLPF